MFINIAFAVPAVIGTIVFAPGHERHTPQRLDLIGAVTVTLGLFALVLGTSSAETSGWESPATIGTLVLAAGLLAAFVLAQTRVAAPLLPLRIPTDRGRGGALIALLLASAGLFTTFLFLPFYLQVTLGYSQVATGLSFLPVPVTLVLSAAVIGPVLTRALGARSTTPLGLTLAGTGVLLLTRIGLNSGYVSHLLPSLVLIGAGIGLVIATATAAASFLRGVRRCSF
ncbi:hypothetical protein [Modestobacter sp. VKM Ac-2978]|uniref:hypothetical protein n=1 Tax=Modestobacter sp. VKM Ac-2978 TaxID=3004132 RepID=UPI0022AB1032|nr:hypothetical protein [Modestobacter sp. VKM Ac-2978]MCZ2849842.1 hypothetical protein [Modestobacter sp. VKM Ac-2978]